MRRSAEMRTVGKMGRL
jgi:hypothetical protein